MLSMIEATERVARGAAHLDRVRPGWYEQIDVGTLTLTHCLKCVVGQLTGHYYAIAGEDIRGLAAIGLTGVPWFHASQDGSDEVTHGFSLVTISSEAALTDDRSAEWQCLQDAWIEAIAARRCPVKETTDADVSTSDVRVGQR